MKEKLENELKEVEHHCSNKIMFSMIMVPLFTVLFDLNYYLVLGGDAYWFKKNILVPIGMIILICVITVTYPRILQRRYEDKKTEYRKMCISNSDEIKLKYLGNLSTFTKNKTASLEKKRKIMFGFWQVLSAASFIIYVYMMFKHSANLSLWERVWLTNLDALVVLWLNGYYTEGIYEG